ncbi:hypothetical protein FDECE_7777 [Fusarium decemcellulare]|nr:hypothetical protein FDECE_7777 [Fusarium decemcellulare]
MASDNGSLTSGESFYSEPLIFELDIDYQHQDSSSIESPTQHSVHEASSDETSSLDLESQPRPRPHSAPASAFSSFDSNEQVTSSNMASNNEQFQGGSMTSNAEQVPSNSMAANTEQSVVDFPVQPANREVRGLDADVTLPWEPVFISEDITGGQDPILNVVVRTGLVAFSVEYFRIPNSNRSSVRFHVLLNQPVTHRDHNGEINNITGVTLTMGRVPDTLLGRTEIRYVYNGQPVVPALADFPYRLANSHQEPQLQLKTIHLLHTIAGIDHRLAEVHRTDLTLFDFVNGPQGPRGHRDIMAQWFIRLNVRSIVRWVYIDPEYVPGQEQGPAGIPETVPFEGIICFNFNSVGDRDENNRLIMPLMDQPIRRGNFVCAGVRRITTLRGHALPYEVDETQVQGTMGSHTTPFGQ